MTITPPQDIRASLADFVRFRREHLTGDEKGEAQVFLDRLFRAFGHGGIHEAGASLETRIKKRDSKGTAFADLMWKPRCLIEMKKARADLSRHYRQAFDYWVDAVPHRPRYVTLCNFDEFWVYDFDNQMDAPVDCVLLDQLPERYEALSFLLPEDVKPSFNNDLVAVTREAAASVAEVFTSMHARGIPRDAAQHFTLQSVMAMFSEDIGLLPRHMFTHALEESMDGGSAYDLLTGLFREMNTPGTTPAGRYKGTPYFNGGLFANITAIEPSAEELELLHRASQTNWAAVRPEIFGTLFEGSMSKGERHAWGAHFTSQADIVKVVGPTIVEPWREKILKAGSIPELEKLLGDMLRFKILDPACGSGNFLYVAYREMRRLEHEINTLIGERRRGSLYGQGAISYVPADHFFGMDINSFAVEIAKVTMMLAKKLSSVELDDNQETLPLANLDSVIVARDALFSPWPEADVIIGNPPYLGRRFMNDELGPEYTNRLATKYPRIGGVSDYVCYWFPLAHDRLPAGGRAGFVATSAIRLVEGRKASLDYVTDNGGVIFNALSSQPWPGDASVHVSIVNWSKEEDVTPKILWLNNGDLRLEMDYIPGSLAPDFDVRDAEPLAANRKPQVCFQGQTPGVTKGFVLNEKQYRAVLAMEPSASDAIHPFLGGREMLNKIDIDRWVIDIEHEELFEVEARYPHLLKQLKNEVLPERRRAAEKEELKTAILLAANPKARPNRHHAGFLSTWWQLGYRRNDMLDALASIDRYLATSRVASVNRDTVFEFVDSTVHPSDAMTVFAFADDYSFGILSSALHQAWIVARCSRFKGDPRYTSTTVFDSFPWPQELSERQAASVAEISGSIVELRSDYLERGITLARQYNDLRLPGKSKLRDLHEDLNKAVLACYGFTDKDDYLAQLFALNQDLLDSPVAVRGPGGSGLKGVRVSDYRLR
ncbi:DNA methyltransferase [Nonomuraea spiralis]|uniref:site-specific DNA-methyltransferase (adenine-specific) n=1 Tax=Nonomuraea spiralis TaxID=46182 RepID=A0ABV5IUR6_9ACTN|nr:DNA methyltransferase [Nonomuraea spiralis]GGT47349.1 DNA modification methyltransferase [Nonomuraea spiralis]